MVTKSAWKVSLWQRTLVGWEMTQENEPCPSTGNDLMTFRGKPTFSFLHPKHGLILQLHVHTIKQMLVMNFLHPQTAVSVYNEVKKKISECVQSKVQALFFQFSLLSSLHHCCLFIHRPYWTNYETGGYCLIIKFTGKVTYVRHGVLTLSCIRQGVWELIHSSCKRCTLHSGTQKKNPKCALKVTVEQSRHPIHSFCVCTYSLSYHPLSNPSELCMAGQMSIKQTSHMLIYLLFEVKKNSTSHLVGLLIISVNLKKTSQTDKQRLCLLENGKPLTEV